MGIIWYGQTSVMENKLMIKSSYQRLEYEGRSQTEEKIIEINNVVLNDCRLTIIELAVEEKWSNKWKHTACVSRNFQPLFQ